MNNHRIADEIAVGRIDRAQCLFRLDTPPTFMAELSGVPMHAVSRGTLKKAVRKTIPTIIFEIQDRLVLAEHPITSIAEKRRRTRAPFDNGSAAVDPEDRLVYQRIQEEPVPHRFVFSRSLGLDLPHPAAPHFQLLIISLLLTMRNKVSDYITAQVVGDKIGSHLSRLHIRRRRRGRYLKERRRFDCRNGR
nr:hypothetical protein [Fulvimarina manganoxydans]